jgi:hypothetical protein
LKRTKKKLLNRKKGKMIFRFKGYGGSIEDRYTLTADNLKRVSQRSPEIRRFFDGHTRYDS